MSKECFVSQDTQTEKPQMSASSVSQFDTSIMYIESDSHSTQAGAIPGTLVGNPQLKSKDTKTPESLHITVNGKAVRLYFMPEPNREAASFIKKTLISAYALKAG